MRERRVRRRPAQQASRSLMISFFWLRRAKRGSNEAGGAMILGAREGKARTHVLLHLGMFVVR